MTSLSLSLDPTTGSTGASNEGTVQTVAKAVQGKAEGSILTHLYCAGYGALQTVTLYPEQPQYIDS